MCLGYDREASAMMRRSWPTRGYIAMKKTRVFFTSFSHDAAVQKRYAYCSKFSCCFITVQVRNTRLGIQENSKTVSVGGVLWRSRTWYKEVGGLIHQRYNHFSIPVVLSKTYLGAVSTYVNFIKYNIKVSHRRHICNC